MTSTQIAKTDLKALLEATDGSYVEAYKRLLTQAQDEAIAGSRRSTIADRKARWAKALAKMDRGVLAKVNKAMGGYLKQVRAETVAYADEPRQMTDVEAMTMMERFLAMRDIDEFLKTDRELMKQAVFSHLTEQFAEQGEEFPEHINGYIEVPELGYKFCRQRTGRKDPTLDEEKLAELLGDDFDEVMDVELKEVRTLNVEKLMKLGRLEEVRAALTFPNGEWNAGSFTVLPMPPEKE